MESPYLFSTPHGTVYHFAPDAPLEVKLHDVEMLVALHDLNGLRTTVQTVAREIGHDPRSGWHLEAEDENGACCFEAAFNSDDVLELEALLSGAAAMLELNQMLGTLRVQPAGFYS